MLLAGGRVRGIVADGRRSEFGGTGWPSPAVWRGAVGIAGGAQGQRRWSRRRRRAGGEAGGRRRLDRSCVQVNMRRIAG
jgi:hypothetical protein